MQPTVSPQRTVRLGTAAVEFPSAELAQIEDSSSLLALPDGGAALRARFARDGFVYLRGALGADAVQSARAEVVAHLRARGGVLEGDSDSALRDGCGLGCLPMLEGVNDVTHSPRVLGVLEGAPLRAAVAAVLGAPADALRSFDYKWLRAMPRAVFTGAHCDSVYMARGSPQLLTCWVPLERAATLELGGLALLRGSHAARGLAAVHDTYCAFDTEAEPGFEGTGWLTSDPRDAALQRAVGDGECQWVAGDYAAGDVVIFGMRTLHMSTANLTDDVRISCDVRWQRADEPIDDRYVGTREELEAKARARKKGGAWADAGGGGPEQPLAAAATVSMQQLRERWGL